MLFMLFEVIFILSLRALPKFSQSTKRSDGFISPSELRTSVFYDVYFPRTSFTTLPSNFILHLYA